MKRGIFVVLIFILSLQFVLADTTFFEGDYGYRDDFIMSPEEVVDLCGDGACNNGESCETCPQDCGVCINVESVSGSTLGRGGGLNKELVCDVCFDSLKEHIDKYRDIDYDEREIETLSIELEEELNVRLLDYQVAALVENFDDECGRPYPVLSGFATGRYRDLLSPMVITVSVIVLGFFIFLYFVLRRLKRFKFRKKKSKSRKKLKTKRRKKK